MRHLREVTRKHAGEPGLYGYSRLAYRRAAEIFVAALGGFQLRLRQGDPDPRGSAAGSAAMMSTPSRQSARLLALWVPDNIEALK